MPALILLKKNVIRQLVVVNENIILIPAVSFVKPTKISAHIIITTAFITISIKTPFLITELRVIKIIRNNLLSSTVRS